MALIVRNVLRGLCDRSAAAACRRRLPGTRPRGCERQRTEPATADTGSPHTCTARSGLLPVAPMAACRHRARRC